MSELTLATWPLPQDSLILTAARTVLHAIAQADAQADGQVDAGADPDPGLVALRARLGPITPQRAAAWPEGDGTRRVLVEYDDFVSGIITRYEAALIVPPASGTDPHSVGGNAAAERPLQDSPDEFRRFASKDFSRFKAFVIRWIEKAAAPAADLAPDSAGPAAGPIRILVPRSLLLADPGPWLDHALSSLDLRLAADPAALAALRDRAMVWLAALSPQALPPDPAAFRHFDPTLFAQLSQLVLKREVVLDVFASVMGRSLEERSVLHFQAAANREALAAQLMRSKEYRTRKQPGETATLPPLLIHLHIPKSAGTSLTSILAGQFGLGQKLALDGNHPETAAEIGPAACNRLRLVFGHLSHGVGRLFDRQVLYVCALRQPGPRLLSFYRYVKRREDHPLFAVVNDSNMSFGDFLVYCANVPAHQTEVHNGQVRRLSGQTGIAGLGQEHVLFRQALRHVLAPDMIFGLTERFEALLDDLVGRGLISTCQPVTANAAPETASFAEARAALTATQDDLLDRFTAWDQKLYDICATDLFGLDAPGDGPGDGPAGKDVTNPGKRIP